MNLLRLWACAVSTAAGLFVGGCMSYVAPGAVADFHAMGISKTAADNLSDTDVEMAMNRKPAAAFPPSIVLARVQGQDYSSMTNRGYGRGRYTIITTRDVEKDEDIARLEKLPMIRSLGTLNRLVLPSELNNERDLRIAAANAQADILVLYTFDTHFQKGDTTIPALGVITLGLFPNEVQRATSTASAAFIDTRTGFIYGLCEATAKRERLSNACGSESALDTARRYAEEDAFHALVGQMEGTWKGIVAQYGPGSIEVQPRTPGIDPK